VLAVIVIASLAGIYFLLRYGEPSSADRAARRRKYSIRRRGVRTHPLPIGLPGSLSEKIGSMFKGRRAGAGWVPAHDEDDGDDGGDGGYRVGANVWDSTDEPLHERELDRGFHGDDEYLYPRVGSTPASRFTVEATAADTHRSREATHVDAAGAESSARLLGSAAAPASPAPATQAPVPASALAPALAPSLVQREVPDEAWHNADDTRSGVGGGGADGSHAASSLGYYAPQPRRADSGYEIPLFAGSTPFGQDTEI